MSRRLRGLLLQTCLNTHLARKAEVQMLSGTWGITLACHLIPATPAEVLRSEFRNYFTLRDAYSSSWPAGEFEETVLGSGPIQGYLDANTNCLQWSLWPTIFQGVSPLGCRLAKRGYEKWSHPGVTLEGLPWPVLLPRSSPCPGQFWSMKIDCKHLWRNPEGHLWPLLSREKMPHVRMC